MRLILDYRTASLTVCDLALCDFAVKLTLAPGKVIADDLVKLRDTGWNDAEILAATQVAGYFNYINRVADGLGVDSESWMSDPPWPSRERWLDSKGSFSPSM